jgi:hypothetical protein
MPVLWQSSEPGAGPRDALDHQSNPRLRKGESAGTGPRRSPGYACEFCCSLQFSGRTGLFRNRRTCHPVRLVSRRKGTPRSVVWKQDEPEDRGYDPSRPCRVIRTAIRPKPHQLRLQRRRAASRHGTRIDQERGIASAASSACRSRSHSRFPNRSRSPVSQNPSSFGSTNTGPPHRD